jgi:hypothetical protein
MNNNTTVLLGHSSVNITVILGQSNVNTTGRNNTDSLQFDYLVCGDLTTEYLKVKHYGLIVCILKLNH